MLPALLKVSVLDPWLLTVRNARAATLPLAEPKRIHPCERVVHVRINRRAAGEPNRVLTGVLPCLRVVVSEAIGSIVALQCSANQLVRVFLQDAPDLLYRLDIAVRLRDPNRGSTHVRIYVVAERESYFAKVADSVLGERQHSSTTCVRIWVVQSVSQYVLGPR
jgi:hypothetical protein